MAFIVIAKAEISEAIEIATAEGKGRKERAAKSERL